MHSDFGPWRSAPCAVSRHPLVRSRRDLHIHAVASPGHRPPGREHPRNYPATREQGCEFRAFTASSPLGEVHRAPFRGIHKLDLIEICTSTRSPPRGNRLQTHPRPLPPTQPFRVQASEKTIPQNYTPKLYPKTIPQNYTGTQHRTPGGAPPLTHAHTRRNEISRSGGEPPHSDIYTYLCKLRLAAAPPSGGRGEAG